MLKRDLSEVLERGVEKIYPSRKALEQALLKPQKLSFYWGIDPTAPFLHLGHAAVARKLEQLRKLGSKVILLIGNFTATIGDPTDKLAARKPLSQKIVEANAKDYLKQLSPILGIKDSHNPVEIKYNADWLGKMTLVDFIKLAQNITVPRLLERDMFQERLKSGKAVFLHEFFYPLLQGYDSVAMKVDGEMGGNDQTFNMLVGRDLVKTLLGKEKFVITTKLLTDPAGRKMGKSEGNVIALNSTQVEMYGAIMSWPDGVVADAFELLTDLDLDEVKKMERKLSPRDFKARLALEVITVVHGKTQAKKAEAEFNKVFRQHGVPEQIKELKLAGINLQAPDILVRTRLAGSRSEARRIIEQGGMKINQTVVKNPDQVVELLTGDVVSRGKRHFVRIV